MGVSALAIGGYCAICDKKVGYTPISNCHGISKHCKSKHLQLANKIIAEKQKASQPKQDEEVQKPKRQKSIRDWNRPQPADMQWARKDDQDIFDHIIGVWIGNKMLPFS